MSMPSIPARTNNRLAGRLLHRITTLILAVLFALSPFYTNEKAIASEKSDVPNIVLILADDLGYGDVQLQNPDSKIPTPNLDSIAKAGMRFTDAHSPSAVCTPTRYATLTGRYCWRTSLKRGVLGGYSKPLIDAERSTMATMLKKKGYHTAAIGKWHLGMEMPHKSDTSVAESKWDGDGNVDFAGKIENGPTARGFDYYFGVSASLDMAPYVWIENDGFVTPPSMQQKGEGFPGFIRTGPRAKDFVITEVLDTLGDKAAAYIADQAKTEKPFFLYLPLTAPHKPVSPHARFQGKSEAGVYGDFLLNLDAVVGKVLAAIETANISESTLVVFTSDNGNFMFRAQEGVEDHLSKPSIQAYLPEHHTPNYHWRGTKADVYEAGHRVPLLVRWPKKVQPGTTSTVTTTHTDWYATFAEITASELGKEEAEDSFSLLPVLLQQEKKWSRAPVINHSVSGMFAIRDGKWKLIAGNGSGGREKPSGKPFAKPYQLYDLEADPSETTNLIEKHPDIAEQLEKKLGQLRADGRSR
jgi:arylsulfatase A